MRGLKFFGDNNYRPALQIDQTKGHPMATYIAHNQSRDTVTIMLSKAEADGLRILAEAGWENGELDINSQTERAANRALDALTASTNTSARRAGYFDT